MTERKLRTIHPLADLTIPDVMERFGVGYQAVNRWMKRGELKALKFNEYRWHTSEEWIQEFIDAHINTPRETPGSNEADED